MKSLMLLLALGLASSDKLDRTYLPPPGSKVAGGSDGAIQVPLEFPKKTYSTTVRPLRPGQKDDRFLSAGDTQPTIGVGLPNILPGSPGLVKQTYFGDLQNKLPTTTTTYAFTQTTTFPPPVGFETTAFPSDVSRDIANGVYTPSGHNQGYSQPSSPTYVQPGTQIVNRPGIPTAGTVHQPGYQSPAQTFIGHPGYSQPSIIQYLPGQTASTTVSPIPGSRPGQPLFDQGYTEHLGVQPPRQFGQQVISSSLAPQDVPQNYPTGSTPVYYENTVQQPVAPGQRTQNLGQQNLQTIQPGGQYVTDNQGHIVPITSSEDLGGQRPLFDGQIGPTQPGISPQLINNVQRIPGSNLLQQLGGQQPAFSDQQGPLSPTSTKVLQPGLYSQYSNVLPGSNISQPGIQVLNQQQGQQGPYTGVPQYQGGIIPVNQPGFTPVTVSPQGTPSTSYQPGSFQAGVIQPSVYQPGVLHPGSAHSPSSGNIPQTTIYPGQPAQIIPGKPGTIIQPTQGSFNQNNYQSTDRSFPLQQHPGRPGVPSIYGLDSTGPTSIAPGYNQPSYSSTPSGIIPGSFPSTTISPFRISSSTPHTSPGHTNIIPGEILRPERPQAEFDRNAEILNYKNILTPDGEFEYSFDTSNGIHADENGTSIDGVKAEGSYSYIGDDGKIYSVVYSADENGFRPHGAHLPTPPPIPDVIQKVIEQATKDKEAGVSHDGFYDEDKYGHKNYQSPNRKRPQQQDKFISNEADVPNDYDEVIRPGQIRPGHFKPGQVRPGTKGDESRTHGKPNTAADVDEYDEYILKSEDLNNDAKLPGSRTSAKRPLDKQQNRYTFDADRRIIPDKKPLSTDFRGDNKDRNLPGVTQPSSHHRTTPGRKPISRPGLSKDGYETEGEDIYENGDVVKDYEKDSKLPSTGSEIEYYDQDEQKIPGRFSQQYTGKPAGTKRPVSTTMHYNNEEQLTNQPGVHQVKQAGRRPLKPSYNKYDDNGDYYKNDVPDTNIVSGEPQGSRRPVSQNTKYYSEQPGLPHYDTTDDNERELYDQGNVRQHFDQGKESTQSKYPVQSANKDTGYQYLPPQHKFQETDRFSNGQYPEVTLGSGTRRPVTKGDSDEKTTFQSFTPDDKPGQVAPSPNEYTNTAGPGYDEKDKIEGVPSQPQFGGKYSDDSSIQQDTRPGHGGSRYPGQLRPGQVYSEERVEGSKIPSYVMSSTTPIPSRGRTPTKGRPQYEQTYDQSFPSSTIKPGIILPGRPRPGYDVTTIPGSSTIIPGQNDISRPSTRLSYQYGDRTTPGGSRVSSNSPDTFTSQPDRIHIDQTRPGYTSENIGVSRRPTTYYPDTITPGSDTIIPGTKIHSRPGIQNVPSTTYRPIYTIIDETTGRPITVDAFGTPVSTTYRPEYTVNYGPSTTLDQFRPIQGPGTSEVQTAQVRPNEPRFQQSNAPSFDIQRPGSQVSSTTERIIGEDFTGPKQPQRFDPQTGYHY